MIYSPFPISLLPSSIIPYIYSSPPECCVQEARICICVREGVSLKSRMREAKEQRGTGWGAGGSDTPGREAISQLVCSLGSQAENAADLCSKLKWCQWRNKAPS